MDRLGRLGPDVPWGRPPLADIPVPPFADRTDWLRFHDDLAVYLAHLAKSSGTVDPATFALLSALDLSLAPVRRHVDAPPDGIAPWVLRIAVSVFFPAPWSPAGLVAQFNAALFDPYRHWTATADSVGYDADPDFRATRALDGRWTVVVRERGSEWVAARLSDDDDMVLYLMEHERTNPYPFGWVNDPDRVAALREPAARAAAAWPVHAALPYLRDWPR